MAVTVDAVGHAPVALFVYNRPDHTRQTLAALRANTLANETPLYYIRRRTARRGGSG